MKLNDQERKTSSDPRVVNRMSRLLGHRPWTQGTCEHVALISISRQLKCANNGSNGVMPGL